MKTVFRQDGTPVELSDAEAEQWIKRGLATAPPVAAPAKPEKKKPFNQSEGEIA